MSPMPTTARPPLTLGPGGLVYLRPWPAGLAAPAGGRLTMAAAAVAEAPAPGAAADAAEASHRVLSGLAVPWRVPTVRWGSRVQFTPETLRLPDDLASVKVLVQHDDERPVGYLTAAVAEATGLRVGMAVPLAGHRTAEAMTDLDQMLRDGLSVGVELDPETMERVIDALWEEPDPAAAPIDMAGLLREVSLVTLPQYLDARVAAASGPVATFSTGRNTVMPATTATPAPSIPPAVPPHAAAGTGGDPTGPSAGPGGVAMSLPELAEQLRPLLTAAAAGLHPLARFGGLGELMLAARDDRGAGARTPDGERLTLALADQITTNNPGVLPPTWLTEVAGIIDRGRPAITAFGGALGAGDSGMSLTWPYYDGDIETLVDVQAAEKTEVTTGRVDIKSKTANLATYAGASDISYQLLRRSSPSYRELYGRILSMAYAARTDRQFCTDITAAGVAGPSWDGATSESLLAALFAASELVDDAAGVPASIAVAAPDVFALIGGGIGLLPPAYGVSNQPGTAQASTLSVSVSGLTITKARHLAAGTFIVSTPEAAKWREDGPFPVEADDVAVLGRDVGVWGMGMTTVMVPAALVKVTGPVLPLSAKATAKASK